jgi:hypothetical protein
MNILKIKDKYESKLFINYIIKKIHKLSYENDFSKYFIKDKLSEESLLTFKKFSKSFPIKKVNYHKFT